MTPQPLKPENLFRPTVSQGLPAGCGEGFTLLEILVAIFIFAIVVTTVFGSFRAVFGNAGALEEVISADEMAGACLSRIAEDLAALYLTEKSAYRPPEGEAEPDPLRVLGELEDKDGGTFSRLRFASLAHLPFGPSRRAGVAEIVYYVETAADESRILRRADRLDPFNRPKETEEGPANDPVLCENIKGFRLVYLSADGEENETWDSDAEEFGYATPQAIRIRLEIGQGETIEIYDTTVRLAQQREKRES